MGRVRLGYESRGHSEGSSRSRDPRAGGAFSSPGHFTHQASVKRRTFVQAIGATAASIFVAPRRGVAAKRLDRVGLELYSVRNAMKADPDRTMAAVRKIGYTDVELLWSFNNFRRTPQQVLATLRHEGLRAPSAHISPNSIGADWDQSVATAKLLGHKYLIVASLPESANTLDAWREWADRFNTAGAVARRSGVWLAFHT